MFGKIKRAIASLEVNSREAIAMRPTVSLKQSKIVFWGTTIILCRSIASFVKCSDELFMNIPQLPISEMDTHTTSAEFVENH